VAPRTAPDESYCHRHSAEAHSADDSCRVWKPCLEEGRQEEARRTGPGLEAAVEAQSGSFGGSYGTADPDTP
jgi:hypothetical protein